jgi:amidase
VQITPDGIIFNGQIKLPSRPMIGRIGLAPKEGPLPSNAKGNFGGGMGNTQIGKGATVYLPVFHEGGLLTIGDCHAAMGDGEATASAVECAVDATLRVTIEERFKVNRPVVETSDEVMTTGEGDTLEAATHMAIDAMADLLMEQLGIDDTDAAMLILVKTGIL